MIAALLGRCFVVHQSAGNLNNHYGLPLTLLGLEPEHEIAVVELAMSAAGEIAHLASIAEPETGVVTNVAPAHLEFFDSVDSIAKAKRELVENLSSRSGPPTAVLNYDDPRVRKFAEGFEGKVVTFGLGPARTFRRSGSSPEKESAANSGSWGRTWMPIFYSPLPGATTSRMHWPRSPWRRISKFLPAEMRRAWRNSRVCRKGERVSHCRDR